MSEIIKAIQDFFYWLLQLLGLIPPPSGIYDLTITIDKTEVYVGEPFTVTAKLTLDDKPVANQVIYVFANDIAIGEAKTNSEGIAEITAYLYDPGSYSIYAEAYI